MTVVSDPISVSVRRPGVKGEAQDQEGACKGEVRRSVFHWTSQQLLHYNPTGSHEFWQEVACRCSARFSLSTIEN